MWSSQSKKNKSGCFVVTNIYQLIVSFVYARNLEVADLYIFGMFSGYEEIGERIRSTGVFRNVYTVDCEKLGVPGKYRAVWQMLFSGSTVKPFLPKDAVYDTFYTSSKAHIKTIMFHVLKQRNPEIKLVFIEDGLGSYSKGSHVLKTTALRKKVEDFLHWDLYEPSKISFLLNLPDMFTAPTGYENCRVNQYPTEAMLDKQNISDLNKVFGVTPQDAIVERVIIYDTLRGLEKGKEPEIELLDQCYEIALDEFGAANVISKPHPRSRTKTESGVRVYERDNVPAELLYNNMEGIENRILISYNSSATFTPKMLYGKEPVIIFLYKITEKRPEAMNVNNELAEKIRNAYHNHSRVHVPNSIEEYKNLVHKLAVEYR